MSRNASPCVGIMETTSLEGIACIQVMIFFLLIETSMGKGLTMSNYSSHLYYRSMMPFATMPLFVVEKWCHVWTLRKSCLGQASFVPVLWICWEEDGMVKFEVAWINVDFFLTKTCRSEVLLNSDICQLKSWWAPWLNLMKFFHAWMYLPLILENILALLTLSCVVPICMVMVLIWTTTSVAPTYCSICLLVMLSIHSTCTIQSRPRNTLSPRLTMALTIAPTPATKMWLEWFLGVNRTRRLQWWHWSWWNRSWVPRVAPVSVVAPFYCNHCQWCRSSL